MKWNNKNNGTLLLVLRKTFRYFVLWLIVCYVLTVGGKTIFHLTVGAMSTKSMPLSSRKLKSSRSVSIRSDFAAVGVA